MGFICERYNDNRAGLIVAFRDGDTTETYYAGDSANGALEYFNLYIDNNTIFARTDEEVAMETAGIQSIEEAEELREMLNGIISGYSDEQAAESAVLFPLWAPGKNYTVGDRMRYGSKLYKVLQAHTSQSDWTPNTAVSLYAVITTGDEPGEWVQPDSTNPYMKGDRVKFEGKIYESLIDNNTWSPIAYPAGWKEIG